MAEKIKEKYEESKLYRLRHSTAHVMAEAVLDKFPEAKIAIGPAIEDGFYYDFDLPRPITPEDLKEIEQRMQEIVKGKFDFKREVVDAEQAKELFKDQPFKLELIRDLEAGTTDEHGNPIREKPELSIYKSDTFVDLCRGPHVENTAEINPKSFKLLTVAGAYWRGDEKNAMLQRIYGTVWETPEELKEYLRVMEEAKKRDHRKLGKELDLFSSNDEIGTGLILWHPNGAKIRKIMTDFWNDEHEKSGYDFVFTPHIGKASLWETSGHLGFYKDNMYSPIDIDGQQYFLKPMNCPFHLHIYKSRIRSYRELPLRFAEMGTVYRYERSGVLHGLLRVRGFTQDDAHHFCTPEQMPDEIDFVLNFCLHILRSFGFTDFKAYLGTKPHDAIGEDSQWAEAEAALRASLDRSGLDYETDAGGGAFYGPKIDLKVKDAIGREWQLSTNQFDFNLPERFDLTYIGEDGQQHRPYMVHRALMGSMERFFGILIEHYGGAFPVWLAPIQAVAIPIADRHFDYAKQMVAQLKAQGIRASLDDRGERMNAKIRDAQKQKIPYMLVIGDQEMESGQVALRLRSGENPGPMSLDAFIAKAKQDIAEKI
ncbi:threonine--tRNA ligase [Pelolinea submarina]|uniref:Threonine--tRNA ligase n=1 Tax=Pelolinea submarina TaxID=913107 RepID=A0A347ZV13_9CHLR|nr:threonine--tRNA ligase [Pelolinea submarina]REG10270.1 threonyl-tRNA synthetase [Pelolinea submarina]BBB49144.1 threonyl-tRNA synthetase [Pelolinea submarina]